MKLRSYLSGPCFKIPCQTIIYKVKMLSLLASTQTFHVFRFENDSQSLCPRPILTISQ